MMKRLWTGVTRIGAAALALNLGWQAWDTLEPQKPEVSPIRKEAVAELIPSIVEDLRQARGDIRSVALLPLVNDFSGYATDQVRSATERSGILNIYHGVLWDGLYDSRPSCAEPGPAVNAVRKLGVQGVIFGTVHAFESVPGGAKLDLEIQLADVATGKVLFRRRYANKVAESGVSVAAIREKISSTGGAKRFVSWVLLVLLLPVFTISFIGAVVRKESNRANAFALGLYTLIGGLAAYLLIGGFHSWLAVAMFLAGTAVAFAYNMFIMSFALRLET